MRGGIKAPHLEQLSGSERTRFNVTCMNGEQYMSPYYEGRLPAVRAAREYCADKGGISGHASYDTTTNMYSDLY